MSSIHYYSFQGYSLHSKNSKMFCLHKAFVICILLTHVNLMFCFRVTSSVAKSHGMRGKSQRGNHPKSPRPPKKSSSEHDTVTLDDVKGQY